MASKRNRNDGRARISWLHLSDLHVTKQAVGGKPVRRLGLELWDEIRRAFFTDLERQIEKLRLVPDLVLITGDLACSGERQQYEDFDAELLLPLLDRLRARGGDPVVFAVPGNHDVKRPMKLERAKYDCLSSYHARDDEHPTVKLLREALWAERDGSFLAPLFADYQAWAERTMLPTLAARTTSSGMLVEGLHTSHVPGDLSVVVSRGDLRLLLVGLNSAWIQYDGGDFTKKLHVPLAQLHAALAKDEPLERFDGITTALLLMHHPPVLTSDHGHPWLSKTAKDEFDRYVHPATEDRFASCLFGHMHEARAQMRAGSGAAMRYFYQSPSLFGLEKYAERAQRLDVGYTLGVLHEDREIRLWVRRWTSKDSGASVFSPDHELHLEEDGSFVLRPAAPKPSPPPRPAEPKKRARARKTARTKAGTTHAPFTSLATGLEQVTRELVDVLAKAVHDPEGAKTMAMRAGFPAEHLPAFKTAIAFWHDVVAQCTSGRLGLDTLVEEAVDQFPHNSRLLAVSDAIHRASSAAPIHPPEADRASDRAAPRAALYVAEAGEQGVEIDGSVAETVWRPEWVEETTGIRFIGVPGGGFVMGSDEGEAGADPDDVPSHRVLLSPFMLAETPVTNAQYGVFMRARPRVQEPKFWRDRRFSGGDQPVVGVSWNDAQAFCAWLAEVSGQTVSLPSEAQWERAARGNDRRRYPWGNEGPDESRACYDQDWDTGQPAPVGRHPHRRGPFGHLDLAGNVWEWCQDTWDERAYQRADLWSQTDPVVKHGDDRRRVCRGGGWGDPARHLGAAYRFYAGPDVWGGGVGFRVCLAPASR